jgi:hypothetical protein
MEGLIGGSEACKRSSLYIFAMSGDQRCMGLG